jgi:hypothetical protein
MGTGDVDVGSQKRSSGKMGEQQREDGGEDREVARQNWARHNRKERQDRHTCKTGQAHSSRAERAERGENEKAANKTRKRDESQLIITLIRTTY